ncbi:MULTISPECIES: FMN-binding negative transcriptional regulator [Streptomyces]|jgi:transcriptional regulator|uniref:FMN-binding negative transcriptional regulator n=1 Tax=Streptomyces sp. 900129855 TaxID=3155129 RepID=A0ABV2ZVU8_9ACTN
MLIHPWDAPREDAEWQQWLSARDFGQLAVNGLPGEPPFVQPLHFAYDPDAGDAVTHLARPNPLWSALQANPEVTLSVVDDHVFVPGPWQAPPGAPTEHGTPTSFYTAVQLRCTAHIVDEPAAKADLLQRQLGHFQPEGGSARPTVGEEPYGRMLSGIRGIRLEVTAVRAKFKYAAHRPPETQDRIATGLAARGGPGDAAALAHLLRRRRT